jgi:hypothetical protein
VAGAAPPAHLLAVQRLAQVCLGFAADLAPPPARLGQDRLQQILGLLALAGQAHRDPEEGV